jgi:deazaflavin-dependent oxidoreductase (nitroreductase family)
VIEEFRTNEGRVGGYFEGRPILLLHTRGRRTGAERINPLAYLRDGDRYVVFATKGGSLTHPDWYRNLETKQDVEVEVGTERFSAKATLLASGPERDRLYAEQVAVWPQFGGYEEKTKGHRTIPVIVLERADPREAHRSTD